MKVRIPAVISILTLAAWLPIQAQQSASPNTPVAPSQTTAQPDGKGQEEAAHSCCHPKAQAGQEATETKHDQTSTVCCHGKAGDAVKAACCAGKEAKDMACCGHKDTAGKTAMNCCEGKKDTMCAAKISKNCCSKMNAKEGKSSCAAHADGK